ncbi:hypothetical protein FEE95_11035 [Maribacter algarum]|uniref:DUF2071 domain-containing protein n=1 Tax=Maribacter algarum (ex Zhang et al. 2020) TaxID=2578118 RepID=A0A5S3PQX0_9FLAO|nr:DUF2071 domain-containing protein [Maribacter algarum]TMM57019.1 hypothetical protein FEE95_11035 [Maribacter algarum]
MSSFLKNHPFAVDAFFESSTVLAYAVPKEQLERIIPECLELDTFDDKWGFLACAIVQTKHLRPKGFPKFLGNDFFLTGFRIFVRYQTSWGKRLRGLYIIKSETNKKKMEFFGNIFTHYKYTTTDIQQKVIGNITEISSKKSNFNIQIEHTQEEVELPINSLFSNWKEARRFAGPLPFTFTCNESKKEILIIEGVRSNWKPTPIKVLNHSISFIDSLNLDGVVLANAFKVEQIPYSWKRGKIDLWTP